MATPHKKGTNTSPLVALIPNTGAVKGIDAAYNRAGATSTHTPGGHGSEGGAKLGSGGGSVNAKGGIGEGERNEPSVVGHMFNKLLNGSSETK